MAGIITIAKGHDASYPWKQIGAAEPGKPARNLDKGVGYYLSPAEKGGEPPGTWTGKGVAELGLRTGTCAVLATSGAASARKAAKQRSARSAPPTLPGRRMQPIWVR